VRALRPLICANHLSGWILTWHRALRAFAFDLNVAVVPTLLPRIFEHRHALPTVTVDTTRRSLTLAGASAPLAANATTAQRIHAPWRRAASNSLCARPPLTFYVGLPCLRPTVYSAATAHGCARGTPCRHRDTGLGAVRIVSWRLLAGVDRVLSRGFNMLIVCRSAAPG